MESNRKQQNYWKINSVFQDFSNRRENSEKKKTDVKRKLFFN